MKHEFTVTCPFCAVGCRFKILKGNDGVVFSDKNVDEIDFACQEFNNEGSICPRGHFAFELLSHPKRLGRAFYRSNGKLTASIPEIIFQKIADDLKSSNPEYPLAMLIDPWMSLHDIRALLEFALDQKIGAIDIVMPADRHLFRSLIQNPFNYRKIDDSRLLKNLNHIICLGDVFTKQPVLSRFLLKAKYAFRNNSFYTLNPVPSRTSWFSDIHVNHLPHQEPVYLFYLLNRLLTGKQNRKLNDSLNWLQEFIQNHLRDVFEKYLSPDHKLQLDHIATSFEDHKESAIVYSTHLYNAAGGYLTGIAGSAISELTNSFFIPLYTDGNLTALEEFAQGAFQRLRLGQNPTLFNVMQKKFAYIFAAGWNPKTAYPGQLPWPEESRWIISSILQGVIPQNTVALLPQAHLYEQMDLRTNYLAWQSLGSREIKSPIGAAQNASFFAYLFHQKLTEKNVIISGESTPSNGKDWKENLETEWEILLNRLNKSTDDAAWMVPVDHVSHYRDGFLSENASWTKKDCIDETLLLNDQDAGKFDAENGRYFNLPFGNRKIMFKAKLSSAQPENIISPFGHYSPARKLFETEFAAHNQELYYWCPRLPEK